MHEYLPKQLISSVTSREQKRLPRVVDFDLSVQQSTPLVSSSEHAESCAGQDRNMFTLRFCIELYACLVG